MTMPGQIPTSALSAAPAPVGAAVEPPSTVEDYRLRETAGLRRNQWRFWAVLLLAFGAFVYFLQDVLAPFVAGAIIAYLFDPFADRLERWRFPRWAASLVVLLIFTLLLVGTLVLMTPVFLAQVEQALNKLPEIVRWVQDTALPYIERHVRSLGREPVQEIAKAVESSTNQILSGVGVAARGIISSGLMILEFASLALITLVVAFYLLRDWDVMKRELNTLMPRQNAVMFQQMLTEIDRTLANFVRGQAVICLMLSVYYAIGLSFLGLRFGLLIGIVAGILTFIPYVGFGIGAILAVGLAIAQFGADWGWIAGVGAVMLMGHAVEANYITPKLIGESVGLHPVWVIFALMAGGALVGFVGVLLAVPVAAVIGVVIRFGLRRYKSSMVYHGRDPTHGLGHGLASGSEGDGISPAATASVPGPSL